MISDISLSGFDTFDNFFETTFLLYSQSHKNFYGIVLQNLIENSLSRYKIKIVRNRFRELELGQIFARISVGNSGGIMRIPHPLGTSKKI